MNFFFKFYRNSEINGSFKEMSTPFASLQTLNYMVKALGHVFKYLNTRELLSASRVCTAWNKIAMNKSLVSINFKFFTIYFC
jgi:hypothetical protein